MKSQVLHTVWCHISCEAAGEFWHWSLSGVKGLKGSMRQRRRFGFRHDVWSCSESTEIWHADSFYVNKCPCFFFKQGGKSRQTYCTWKCPPPPPHPSAPKQMLDLHPWKKCVWCQDFLPTWRENKLQGLSHKKNRRAESQGLLSYFNVTKSVLMSLLHGALD